MYLRCAGIKYLSYFQYVTNAFRSARFSRYA